MGDKKKFAGSLFGFSKKEVLSYMNHLTADFEKKTAEKEEIIERFKEEKTVLDKELDDFKKLEASLIENRDKIAEALLSAKEQASKIVNEARIQAVEEKKDLEDDIEKEKEKLVDIRSEIKKLKDVILQTMGKFDTQMSAMAEKVEAAEKNEKLFENADTQE